MLAEKNAEKCATKGRRSVQRDEECAYEVFDIEGVGHVHKWGDSEKPLVILLHGFMQTGLSWGKIAPLLKSHQVLAPDFLGHGKTPYRAGEPLGLDEYVSQVDALVEWAKKRNLPGTLGGIKIVGYSLGGRVAASYAARFPEKVASLVLESAGLGPQNDEERAQRAEKSRAMMARLDQSVASDPARPLAAFVDWWEGLALFESQRALPESVRDRIREERLANDPAALRRNLEDAGQHHMNDLRAVLVNLNKPLLYVVGEQDVAYTEIARSLMRAWAREHAETDSFHAGFVQVNVIPRAGHNTHLEAPEEYAQLVDIFLSRLF